MKKVPLEMKDLPAFGVSPIFGNQYVERVLPFLNNVQEEILIIIYDWRADNELEVSALSMFNEAIFKAVERGVRVRAIVNSEKVKAILDRKGVFARVLPSDKILHTKLLVMDRSHIVLGSHNFTKHAFTSNHELSVYFIDSEFDNKYIAYFENLWSY